MKLKCKFGTPQHGWLPVFITIDDFRLEMDVSDVPVNPIDTLVLSLSRVLNGIESEVWWHLEPASYYFNFVPRGSDKLEFSISFATSNVTSTARQHVFDGSGKRKRSFSLFGEQLKNLRAIPTWSRIGRYWLNQNLQN